MIKLLILFLILTGCGDLEMGCDKTYEVCEEASPGGCNEKPRPTYKNDVDSESYLVLWEWKSYDYTWYCIDGYFYQETWTWVDECWEKTYEYKSGC